MSEFGLAPGLRGEYRIKVGVEHTAHDLGHTGVEVYSTPDLVAAFEMACCDAIGSRLPPGYNHVGVYNEMTHTAATPVGMTVVAKAELVEVDGRRLVFRVEGFDEVEKIGEGRHDRMVVNWSRFEAKLAEKVKP
ncbi:MAG: thioesterase family protein [Chloroflexi bacterium]|nr:thioesterase family protein [Chloroflexota bacterium]